MENIEGKLLMEEIGKMEEMGRMEEWKEVLQNWGLRHVSILHRYEDTGDRIVCRVSADEGEFILKGQPACTTEKIVEGNTRAHKYLGNGKGLAPRLLFTSKGCAYVKEKEHFFYVMEFVPGRKLEESVEDEFILGQATARLHQLTDFGYPCSFNSEEQKEKFREWFKGRSFKKEYDAILDGLPDFNKHRQCFIHTDIGPHNAVLGEEGKVIFLDLDDAGIGSQYLDLGWPFIMQFVDFNKETKAISYRFDLARAFLQGYYGEKKISREEIDRIWYGAAYMHIACMKSYGPEAVDSLWNILKFGMEQKETLFQML